MFKALVDATNYELKVRSTTKEPSNIGITPGQPVNQNESELPESKGIFPEKIKTR